MCDGDVPELEYVTVLLLSWKGTGRGRGEALDIRPPAARDDEDRLLVSVLAIVRWVSRIDVLLFSRAAAGFLAVCLHLVRRSTDNLAPGMIKPSTS